MKWLNIEIKDLTSHEYLGSNPVERSTWIGLLRYCCQQENKGIIKDCINWGDRKWMQLVGITKEEALKNCSLWDIKNNDIIVWHYPKEQEQVIKAKRLAGKRYGKGHPKDSYSTPNSSAKGNSKGNSKSKSKSKKETFIPPTLQEVKDYCKTLDYKLDADKIYHTYAVADWHDTKGNQVKNWKQKIHSVWCKDENKQKQTPSNWCSSII